jgi:hypothetical protein
MEQSQHQENLATVYKGLEASNRKGAYSLEEARVVHESYSNMVKVFEDITKHENKCTLTKDQISNSLKTVFTSLNRGSLHGTFTFDEGYLYRIAYEKVKNATEEYVINSMLAK